MITRRDSLKTVSSGFGYLAFAGLSTMAAQASSGPLSPRHPHFTPKAKRVIFLCMRGAPSHLDTFDHKPDLARLDGQDSPQARRGAKLLGSPFEFKPAGRSGLMISSLFPKVAQHADDLCILNGMHTDIPNHPQAFLKMHTGSFQFVRPSLGAWTLYGLGSENEDLPGFVTLNPPVGIGGAQNYGSAFLPAYYQATKIGQESRPALARLRRQDGSADAPSIPNIDNPRLPRELQRTQLDLVKSLNHHKLSREQHQPEIEGAIESFELAFRMQDTLPEVMDISGESEETLALYGINQNPTDAFGRQCLTARRLAESGVRFIELTHGNWDHHVNLTNALENNCAQTDTPIAGLLEDLKRRDMLKDTLVIWGGEFGRTPHAQGRDGRDHNNKGYTMWMAGGGVRGGLAHGQTDDLGYEAVDGRVHIHDWHATILHLLGLDHTRLTFNYAGRDFRLTDVYGEIAHEIIA